MYRGFNIELPKGNPANYVMGYLVHDNFKRGVRLQIDKLIDTDGALNGTKIQEDWFPQFRADVFISHSHADESVAIELAGWLKDAFGLTAFIDSCIWAYSADLLKIIDRKYCQLEGGYFDYEKRNQSTSHVHMMLSVALARMIDKTECLFFLNTPKSISSGDVIDRTSSPWIYYEIATSQVIRKNIPTRRRLRESKALLKAYCLDESLRIEYDVDLSHLADLSGVDLTDWQHKASQAQKAGVNALDILYDMHGIPLGNVI